MSHKLAFVLAICLLTAFAGWSQEGFEPEFGEPAGPALSKGELRVFQVATGQSESSDAVPHKTLLIPGISNVDVEDNDIRGFLDGNFKHGWNQPGQIHVRFGRRGESPRYGEHELFRVLQRWEGIELPRSARVTNARLTFDVEVGLDSSVDVVLYEIHKDWHPGEGGTQRDNVSPPVPGEAWWNGPRFAEQSWGLPGVGYAASTDGDTPVTALASHTYQPGDSVLSFSDPALASYIQGRLREDEPLLFLLKLADRHEDEPGSMVTVYSVNYGDSQNPAHRPRLELTWTSDVEESLVRERVLIERGRTMLFDPIPIVPGGWLHAEFQSDPGYGEPLVEMRGGVSPTDTSEWRPTGEPMRNEWRWVQIRVRGFQNAVEMGDMFESRIHDTWILTEPLDASVQVAFRAPSGRVVRVYPEYEGNYTWRFAVRPNEFGTWRYQWRAEFASSPLVSPVGEFEVVANERAQVIAALEEFVDDLRAEYSSDERIPESRLPSLHRRFLRLERAAMTVETPDSFQSEENEALQLLQEVREVLGGAPVPDSIPLVVSGSHRNRQERGGGS